MQDQNIKHSIAEALKTFKEGSLTDNALSLFQILGYNTARQELLDSPTYDEFYELYAAGNTRFRADKAYVDEWTYVDLLFQLSKDELNTQLGTFDTSRVDNTIIKSYLFFVIGLSGTQYTRTALSQITREINKIFPMPVMLLFKHGNTLTLSVIDRRLHKKDKQKDVLEKVTLIKDIQIENTHRAHLEILFDLSLDELSRLHTITNFVELHDAWQKALDTHELNKRFYQELSNWYFWAMREVSFPDDVEKNPEIRNATNLIRLITRIIFIWFIREKNFVPETIFQPAVLKRILKNFCDGNSHSYYQAILQNLFFGILNKKINDRKFAKDEGFLKNRTEYGVKTLLRFGKLFRISQEEVLDLFKDVPFLNGGLFDCLDKEDAKGKVIYVDGFSRNNKKQAIVPDYLFFGEEFKIDLNSIYGTRNKKYKTKGLVEILNSYKFTVTENTPIEEEVALDPELLGKVFENLLASYNPETQTTARKETGSFYTPREIVNYMVDESLIAYLSHKLDGAGYADREEGLRELLSYTETPNPFNELETTMLIRSINDCKILDPACGSGAFPMGILHKLVHILHKLDPQNRLWKERQIENAQAIEDPVLRDKSIQSIGEAFEKELDYGRKLYLIENCIYGVDIQPIAVQIAKLRFFISLVINQQKQPGQENFGINALPNLETKFVAANTLIPLEKPEGQITFHTYDMPEIKLLKNKLKQIRHRYFNAKTRTDKLRYQKQDKTTREELALHLIKSRWDEHAVQQLTAFDPYDQNVSAPFFEPEWIFGVSGGFDIVIGNPPYGADIDKFTEIFERIYPRTSEGYKDIYKYFFNRSFYLLNNNLGLLSFITPNTYLLQPRYGDLRRFLLEYRIITIINLGENVFESVVPTVVTIASNQRCNGENTLNFSDISDTSKYPGHISNITFDHIIQKSYATTPNNIFIENIRAKGEDEKILGTIIDFKDAGINYQRVGVGLSNKGSSDLGKRLLYEGTKEEYDHVMYWKGADINAYYVAPYTNRFVRPNIPLNYNERVIINSAYFTKAPKLLWRQTASYPIVSIDKTGIWFGRSIQAGLIKEEYKDTITYEYLCCLLNSRYIKKIYESYVMESGRVFPQVKLKNLRYLPVRLIDFEKQQLFIIIYSYIEHTKYMGYFVESAFFENLNNAMVYELYLPRTTISSCCETCKHLTMLEPLKEDWSKEKKLSIIKKVYEILINTMHPVSSAIKKMMEIPEIKIIEGRQ